MVMVVDMKVAFTFNMSDHIKYMWIGVWRDCGQQRQQGGEDQGGG